MSSVVASCVEEWYTAVAVGVTHLLFATTGKWRGASTRSHPKGNSRNLVKDFGKSEGVVGALCQSFSADPAASRAAGTADERVGDQQAFHLASLRDWLPGG